MSGHKEAPAEQLKSSVASKNVTVLQNGHNKLEKIVPYLHPTLKQRYHCCFCGLPGKPDIIKETHSRNFNRCFLTCVEKERGCLFFQWIDENSLH